MEGGIAILLILIVLVVAGFVASGLFGTGGFLWWRKTDPHEDGIEGSDPDRRPQHTAPTTPAQEHTEFVGGDRPPG
jgi:hypothetical protein